MTRNKSSFTCHKPNHIINCKQSQQKWTPKSNAKLITQLARSARKLMLGLALDYVFLIEKEVACIANQKITTFIIGQCR